MQYEFYLMQDAKVMSLFKRPLFSPACYTVIDGICYPVTSFLERIDAPTHFYGVLCMGTPVLILFYF